jgi:hypothetical protein
MKHLCIFRRKIRKKLMIAQNVLDSIKSGTLVLRYMIFRVYEPQIL